MGQQKNSKSSAVTSPPGYVSDAYKALFKTAGEIGSKPYTPYTGGYTPDQRQAFGNIRNLRGSQDQTFANANAAYQRASVPTYSSVSNYMSPYIDNVVNAAIANMNEQNGQQQQQVIGNAITKGAWGGDRVGVAQAELARQQKLANNDTIANLYKDAFSQALGAAQNQQQVDLGTASGLTGLGQTAMGTNLNQTAAQLGAGTQQQQFDYAQYLNKQGYPYQQASWLSGILGNIGPNAGGSTVQLTPNGNLLTQLLGAGLSIAGLFKDGGVVPRSGYAGGGGVTPVNPWATLPMNGSPYSVSGDSQWGGYIPTDDGGGSRANFPEISQNKPDDPFDLSSPSDAMRAGATNISNWFSGRADGGVIPHMADGGLPTGYADILGGVVKGPNGTIISAPRYSPGYSPSEYAGIYARPSQAPVARSVKTVPVRAASPAYASIPANAGVYGGPGSRPAGMPAVARLAADISPYAPANYGYISSDGDAWASTRGISPAPEAQPGVVTGGRGPLVAAGVANPSPVASYAPTNGTNTNIFTARAAQGHPLSRLFNWVLGGDQTAAANPERQPGPLSRFANWLGSGISPMALNFAMPQMGKFSPVDTTSRGSLDNPLAAAARSKGQHSYTTSSGMLMPTTTIGGGARNTYGDYADGGVIPHLANGGNSWAGDDSSWDNQSAIHNIQWGLKNLGIGNGPDYAIPGAPSSISDAYGRNAIYKQPVTRKVITTPVTTPKMDPVPWSGNDRGWSQFEDWRDDPANGSFDTSPGVVPITVHGGPVAPTPRPRPFSFFGRPRPRPFSFFGRPRTAAPVPRQRPVVQPQPRSRPRPITHNFAPVTHAGERTDVMGNDMAFMPTSVQTSSRWNTGYASGGVVPHMANGGFPDTSGVNINDMFPSINPWVTQPEMTPEAAQLALAAAIPVASKTAADQAASRAAAVQPTSAAIGTGMGDGDYTPVAPPDMGGPQVNAFADVVPANDGGGGVLGAAHDYGQQGGVTPFARGDQFITNPDPRYSQNIGDAFKSLVSGGGLNLDPATRQAMLGMGFGMMASKNPSFLGGVGEGGLKGIETWAGRTNQERENAKTRADLATTAAGLPLTEAQTGFTNVNAAATRYTFRPGLQGVMVTDALNPTATQFVPWGGILPNGQVATEETINNSILFNTKVPSYSDPRGMVPEATSLVLNETAGALGGAREEAIGAASSAQVLNNVRTALDELPADGPLAQGAGFASRLGFAKSVNGALSVLGLAPQFDENAIAAGEDLKKFAFQLGGTMAQGFGGSNTAAGLITDAIADATPNADLTKEGAERIINSLEMINKRKMDYYTLMQQWQGKNGGSIMGFDEWFNRANPPELYAMAAYIPAAAFQRLIDNPKLADDFNKAYGHGRDIARYVIGRN